VKLSDGVEWSLHCCTVLALLPERVTMAAARLAEFHGVPAAYLAKHMQALARAGIVEATQGPKGGYRLARRPTDVSLLDVVLAVEGEEPAFRCTEIRQRGPARLSPRAYKIPCGIARAMWQAEDAWRASLREQTLADLVRGLARDVDPRQAAKAVTWMQEVLT
jgi:Rrf2 family protein